MRNKLSRLIKRDEFPIVLFACISLIAIISILVSRKGLIKNEKRDTTKADDFIIMDSELDSESYMGIANNPIMDPVLIEDDIEKDEETKETMAEPEEEEDMEEDLDFVEEEVPQNPVGDMILPVEGSIITDYTKDSLIYSETLEEWTSHRGIDISAAEGSQVSAARSGIVQEVYNDELWGKVIIVDHGNGIMTKYANLSTADLIYENTEVNKGDIIGQVGKTATIEMMMEPHLHFEVIIEGENVDPKDYMPVLNY